MNDNKQAQKQCDLWNHDNPIGTDVILTNDGESEMLTATRSIAIVRSGEALVHLERMRDFSRLDRVRVRKCRVCGCTTFHACHITREEHGRTLLLGACTWVEKDLCSACVGKAVPA